MLCGFQFAFQDDEALPVLDFLLKILLPFFKQETKLKMAK